MAKGNNEDRRYIVYCHISPSGKRYVGITCQTLKARAGQDGKGYNKSPYFYKAIQKYGWDNFEHIIIEKHLTKEEAIEREKYYIALWRTNDSEYGYNLTAGGETCPEYASEILSKRMMGNKYTYGLAKSDEDKRMMSERAKEYFKTHKLVRQPPTQEQIVKRNESMRPENRVVVQLDLEFNPILVYRTISTASKYTNIRRKCIEVVCKNYRKRTAGGFIWMRLRDYVKEFGFSDKLLFTFEVEDELLGCIEAWQKEYSLLDQSSVGEISISYSDTLLPDIVKKSSSWWATSWSKTCR